MASASSGKNFLLEKGEKIGLGVAAGLGVLLIALGLMSLGDRQDADEQDTGEARRPERRHRKTPLSNRQGTKSCGGSRMINQFCNRDLTISRRDSSVAAELMERGSSAMARRPFCFCVSRLWRKRTSATAQPWMMWDLTTTCAVPRMHR